jgi:hypothetical protein
MRGHRTSRHPAAFPVLAGVQATPVTATGARRMLLRIGGGTIAIIVIGEIVSIFLRELSG